MPFYMFLQNFSKGLCFCLKLVCTFFNKVTFFLFLQNFFKMNLFLLQPFSQGSLWHVGHGFLGILLSQALYSLCCHGLLVCFIFIP